MHFSQRGWDVAVVDNLSKRRWEAEIGIQPLIPLAPLERRVHTWRRLTGKVIASHQGDITEEEFLDAVVRNEQPDTIVHYGEQPSAPFSMRDQQHAVFTQVNNVVGTLNLVFAVYRHCPQAHIIKLGTMGEYGTPNIDIEEGYLSIEHKGRKDILPFPKQPGSFYHLSKVHDSHNLMFAARIWALRVTDLNQGVVYGVFTPEASLHPDLVTSFHYDETFGTVINRFLAQAVRGIPLTVYGQGKQQRSFLNILDTLQCVELAANNPAKAGEFRVFNQFTEQFQVLELAQKVARVGRSLGFKTEIVQVPNPRIEAESHYYNAVHSNLLDLGLQPHLLTHQVLAQMLGEIRPFAKDVVEDWVWPRTNWNGEIRTNLLTGSQP